MKPTIEASSTVSISGSATIPTNSWSPGRWGYRALRFLDQAAFVPKPDVHKLSESIDSLVGT